MRRIVLFSALMPFFSASALSASTEALEQQVRQLQKQTELFQKELVRLQKQINLQSEEIARRKKTEALNKKALIEEKAKPPVVYHSSLVTIHTLPPVPETPGYYPTVLMADNRVVTYLAGTPVVSSPYLGDRPAFDGSDYIVNISSINRDIRLMQQRRRLYEAYHQMGYQGPWRPIIALSGKAEPVAFWGRSYSRAGYDDVSLGASELDVAATLNENVEAFMSIAYDDSPPPLGGQRVSNSAFSLNLGFVNIGNLDRTPFYFTAGQLYLPFGRYSSSMISSPITMILARTKARPFIIGYKSQGPTGPYLAGYGFISDTRFSGSEVGGVNAGYIFNTWNAFGDIGGGYIGTIADAQGMQNTGALANTTFGGFGALNNGSENIPNIPGFNIHGNISFDRYSLTAEWVGAAKTFPAYVLSFNGMGAKPQAAQIEAAVTFNAWCKPASLALGYQWSSEALALHLPKQRISAVFNISLWKDTVESLEYRHDIDYAINQYANGIAAPGFINANTVGTGSASDTLIAQIGVYF